MNQRPPHMSMPSPTPACPDVSAALRRMRADGHSRAAVWGAGDHTRRILGALYDAPLPIVCLIDDDPSLRGARICGWPVVATDDFLAGGEATAVLISSRHAPHVRRMWAARERFEAFGKSLYRLEEADSGPADLAAPSVLVITVPKSGTWLLLKLLSRAGIDTYRGNAALVRLRSGRAEVGPALSGATICEMIPPGQAATFHDPRIVDAPAIEKWIGPGHCRVVLLIRDPRDVVVARAHFWKHPANRRSAMLQGLDVREVMDRIIAGYGTTFAGIRELMLSYRMLYDAPFVHTIRFEELVRAAVDRDDPDAVWPIVSLLCHAGKRDATHDDAVQALAGLNVRPAPGRTTVTDEWRQEFDARQVALFSRQAGDVLEAFDYGPHRAGYLLNISGKSPCNKTDYPSK